MTGRSITHLRAPDSRLNSTCAVRRAVLHIVKSRILVGPCPPIVASHFGRARESSAKLPHHSNRIQSLPHRSPTIRNPSSWLCPRGPLEVAVPFPRRALQKVTIPAGISNGRSREDSGSPSVALKGQNTGNISRSSQEKRGAPRSNA